MNAHFAEEVWVDFARGLTTPVEHASLNEHLRSNCADCRAICNFARNMVDFAVKEQAVEVPEAFVSAAVSVFCPLPVTTWLESLEPIFAELLPALPMATLMAGVRSATCGDSAPVSMFSQRLQYRAGDYAIDLGVEPCFESGSRAIAGQLAHQAGESMTGALVQVWVDGAPVAETRANPFGEFVADFKDGKAVELRIGFLASGRRIDVSLPSIH